MNIQKFLTDDNYIKFSLVGNSYCSKRPSSNDKNAIKVLSVRNDTKHLLGYIAKHQNCYFKKIIKRIKFVTIIKQTLEDSKYYFLIYKFL